MSPAFNPFRQFRYLRRYRQILQVLIKFGFAEVLAQVNLYGLWARLFLRGEKKHQSASSEARLRMALEELGPTFVKIGQILSTRGDLIPPAYTAELSRLQDEVAPFPAARAQQILEAELGRPLPLLFREFFMEPLAAASIGQVHRAMTPAGEPVVVKVKRPGINEQVAQDLDILVEIANLIDRRTGLGAVYQFSRIAGELRQIITRELDFRSEARHAQRFGQHFQGHPHIVIPRIFWEYTTAQVLTLEYRAGVNLSQYLKSGAEGAPSPRDIAAALAESFFQQVFIDGYFHADLHPGNVAVLPDGRLFIMDFGTAGFMTEDLRARFGSLFFSFKSFDTAALVDEILGITSVPPVLNRLDLIRDVRDLQEQYYDLPLKEINLGEALESIMRVAVKHNLRFPYEFLLLIKAMVVLEGTVSRLDPEFSIGSVLPKYGASLQRRQLKYTVRRFRGTLRSYRRLAEEIPERAVEILRSAAAGELTLKVEIDSRSAIFRSLEHMFNRLSFSVVLASLIIGLSLGLWRGDQPWLVQFPFVEIGLIGAGLAGLWWLYAILRSGRL